MCTAMIAENDESLLLEKNSINYDRRSTLLSQHDTRANEILQLIQHMESQLQQSDVSLLIQAVEDLSTNDTLLDLGGVKR